MKHNLITLPWKGGFLCLLLIFVVPGISRGTPLSDPQVDGYNVRVGTETFAGLYHFTSNTLLVETAQAITNMGSDTIKCYLGPDTSFQSGVTLPSSITNLMLLARNEPSYHQVLDMPFRHFIMWAYPFSTGIPFGDGNYTPTEQANDYREMYDLTTYLLTNYNNSGKTFYLGHWEGDGYLSVNNWTTNPSPAVVTAMVAWENNRQKAVDDAKAANGFTNMNVYYYAEANRVRDAMLNGTNNNVRMINYVIPYVTNLDYISYSSYDAQNLSTSDLYTTLNYMEAHFPTNKAGRVPGERMWIGEYGWGGNSTDSQEPMNRAYIQRLLNWQGSTGALQFILFWEMYDNEAGKNFCLIDSNDVKVASWYLQQRFFNNARLLTAQFKETNGRLPNDAEFSSLVSPMLNSPLPAPVNFTLSNPSSSTSSNLAVTMSSTLAQGVYGDDEAGVWVFYGPQDGGTTPTSWANSRFVGVNTNFNPTAFSLTVSNLIPQTNYFFRFYAANANTNAWAPASSSFSTETVNPPNFGSSMKIVLSGYNRSETLSNFPILINLGTNLPGFSYQQFASPSGNDLRFTDASGALLIPHEIDEWNTNGTSTVWVNLPSLSAGSNFIWAYWGNPAAMNPPAYTTNGDAWPNFDIVWHLKENTFPYADSTQQYPALSGVAPAQATGIIGHGEKFNGSSTFLDAGVVNNLGNAFTLSAWLNESTSASNIQALWANQKGGFGSAGFALFVNSFNTTDGKIVFDAGDGTNGSEKGSSSGAVGPNQWHLVTAAVDRTGGTVTFYADGALVGSGTIVTDFVNNADLNFGRFTNSFYYFNGTMDEARIQSGLADSNWVWASWMTVASNSSLANYSAPARQSPVLAIGSSGGGNSVSWPASGVGFALYSTTNLTSPVAWTVTTNQPVFTNNQWQINLPTDTTQRFYRLKGQ